MKKILVTGAAGFIGFHLVNKLVKENYDVVGLDVLNDYYDVNLKFARLNEAGFKKENIEYNKLITSEKFNNYRFVKIDITDKVILENIFKNEKFDYVVNLAAQAGVRYSLKNPHSYIDSNIVGFLNVLEGCRNNKVKHLVYASSSSVYGLNEKQPFSIKDNVDHPISIYAATKKANELMAHSYAYLYNLPATGLRFFTVYGPWGRPDMAYFSFTEKIVKDEPIDVYNYGNMERDFTYIDDIIGAVYKIISFLPKNKTKCLGMDSTLSTSKPPYKIYNIGNNAPVRLLDFIEVLEKKIKKKPRINLRPLQPGDVQSTYADITELIEDFGYQTKISIEEGISEFIEWFNKYYKM